MFSQIFTECFLKQWVECVWAKGIYRQYAGFVEKDAITSTPNLIVLYSKFIASFSSGTKTYSTPSV